MATYSCLWTYSGIWIWMFVISTVHAVPNPCDQKPCGSGGYCMGTNQKPFYQCACFPGFTGLYCRGAASLCTGAQNTCQNGGICFVHGEEVRCRCPSNYYGTQCESYKQELYCPPGGWKFSITAPNYQISDGIRSCTSLISEVTAWYTMDYYRVYCQHFTNMTTMPERALNISLATCTETDQAALLTTDICCPRIPSDHLSAKNIYVSSTRGRDDSTCGFMGTPCKTVREAVEKLLYFKRVDFTINVEGGVYYECNHTDDSITLNMSIEIVAFGGPVLFSCIAPSSGSTYFRIHGSNDTIPKIKLNGITFNRAKIYSHHVDITYQNCIFLQSEVHSSAVGMMFLTLYNSDFLANSKLYMTNRGPVKVHMQDVRFNKSFVEMDLKGNVDLTMSRTNVDFGRFMIFVEHNQQAEDTNHEYELMIHMYECIFSNAFLDGIGQAPNGAKLTIAALEIEYEADRFPKVSSLLIEKCGFTNNSRALGLYGPLRDVLIRQSYFGENTVIDNGGAVVLMMPKKTSAIFNDCEFIQNKAIHNPLVVPDSDTITGSGGAIFADIIDDEVGDNLNGDDAQGMNLHHSRERQIIILACKFSYNLAARYGGAIYTGKWIRLKILSSTFHGPNVKATYFPNGGIEGKLVYSNMGISMSDSSFIEVSGSKTNEVSLVSMSTTGLDLYSNSYVDTKVQILCPIGYNATHSYENVSQEYGVSGYKIQFTCVGCETGAYSMHRGELNITTLRMGGSDKPGIEFVGESNGKDFMCRICPDGVSCEQQEVKSSPNHWALIQDGHMYIHRCPEGYCCGSDNCRSISDCAPNRGGMLCGTCLPQFTQSVFSPTCIENSSCPAWWLWLVTVAVCIAFIVALIFNQHLFHVVMILWLPIWNFTRRFSCCVRCHVDHIDIDDKGTEETSGTQTNNESNRKSVQFAEKQASGDIYREKTNIHYGYLDVIMYLLQTAYVIHIVHLTDNDNNSFWKEFGKLAYNIANFRFLIEYPKHLCIFEGANPAVLEIIHAVIILLLFLMMGMAYIVYLCLNDPVEKLEPAKNARGYGTASTGKRHVLTSPKILGSNLVIALLLLTKFTFQPICLIVLHVLNCVHIGSKYVLYIDGTIDCYETWQVTLMLYGIFCIVPIFLIYLFGPNLMKQRKISSWHFFLGCFVPLVVPIAWLIRSRNPPKEKLVEDKKATGTIMRRKSTFRKLNNLQTRRTALFALEGPFKSSLNLCGCHFNWNGVIMLQKLLLVLVHCMVNDYTARSITIMVFCLIFLVLQIVVSPFRRIHVNVSHTVSLSLLLILAVMNIPKGVFIELEYRISPDLDFIYYITAIFIHWIPTVVLIIIILATAILSLIRLCRKRRELRMGESGTSNIEELPTTQIPTLQSPNTFNSSTLYKPGPGSTASSNFGDELKPEELVDFEIELFTSNAPVKENATDTNIETMSVPVGGSGNAKFDDSNC